MAGLYDLEYVREEDAKNDAWVRSASKASDGTSENTRYKNKRAFTTGQALLAPFSKQKCSSALLPIFSFLCMFLPFKCSLDITEAEEMFSFTLDHSLKKNWCYIRINLEHYSEERPAIFTSNQNTWGFFKNFGYNFFFSYYGNF